MDQNVQTNPCENQCRSLCGVHDGVPNTGGDEVVPETTIPELLTHSRALAHAARKKTLKITRICYVFVPSQLPKVCFAFNQLN